MTDLTSDDPQENSYFSRFAIEAAINGEDPKMLESIILEGGDLNIDLGDGWTPMHQAMDLAIDGMIQNNREHPYPKAIAMIQILVSHGADLEKKNREGKTPLDSINTYAGDEQGFNSLMTMFRDVIPSLDERIQYQEADSPARWYHTVSNRIILFRNISIFSR